MAQKNKWLTAKELMDRWNIQNFELSDRVNKKGLAAYSLNKEPFRYPLHISLRYATDVFNRPGAFKDMSKNLEEFSIYKISDIIDFEKKHDITPQVKKNKAIEQKDTIEKKAVFPCGPETEWKDIKITLTSNDTVRIKTPEGEGVFSYHQLGMADERTKDLKPTDLWALVKMFADNDGSIASKNPKYDPMLPDIAKRLNHHLQQLFAIADSIYTGHYKKEKKYKTKIFFSDQTKTVS